MSDPTERHKIEPHPISSHRTPEEIAEDEAGPIGHASLRSAKLAPRDGERKDVEREKHKKNSKPQ